MEKAQEEVLRAQLEDAQRDAQFWLTTDCSNEERLYLRAMAERLGALVQIVDHRIYGITSKYDEGHWKENVRAFLEHFNKAREVRGYVVGKNLDRLAAVLGGTPDKRADKAVATTAIGRNIDRLRKECGWSFDDLAAQTGIDKKLILSHVNKGTKPTPRILKDYAQAFSKSLVRKITAPDLEI
jgi:hypothetical protein